MWKIIAASATLGITATAVTLFWTINSATLSSRDVVNDVTEQVKQDYSQEITGLRQQLAQLNVQVERLNIKSATATAAPELQAPSDPIQAMAAMDEGFDLTAAEAEEIAHIETIVQYLDDHLIEDPVDPGWSGSAESELADSLLISGDNASSHLDDIQCRSSLCRLSMRHDNPDAESRFSSTLGGMNAFMNSDVFSQRKENADGSVDTLVFISRSGYPLPPLQLN